MVLPLFDVLEDLLAHLVVVSGVGIFRERWLATSVPLFVLFFSLKEGSVLGLLHDSEVDLLFGRIEKGLVCLLDHGPGLLRSLIRVLVGMQDDSKTPKLLLDLVLCGLCVQFQDIVRIVELFVEQPLKLVLRLEGLALDVGRGDLAHFLIEFSDLLVDAWLHLQQTTTGMRLKETKTTQARRKPLPSLNSQASKENDSIFEKWVSKSQLSHPNRVELKLPTQSQFLAQYYNKVTPTSPGYSLCTARSRLHSLHRTDRSNYNHNKNKNYQQTYRPSTKHEEESVVEYQEFQEERQEELPLRVLFERFKEQEGSRQRVVRLAMVGKNTLERVVNSANIRDSEKRKHLKLKKANVQEEIEDEKRLIARLLGVGSQQLQEIEQQVESWSGAIVSADQSLK